MFDVKIINKTVYEMSETMKATKLGKKRVLKQVDRTVQHVVLQPVKLFPVQKSVCYL